MISVPSQNVLMYGNNFKYVKCEAESQHVLLSLLLLDAR